MDDEHKALRDALMMRPRTLAEGMGVGAEGGQLPPWYRRGGQVAGDAGQSVLDALMFPGRTMDEGLTTEGAIPWAANTAMGMAGIGAPFAQVNALGATGGRPRTFWRGSNPGDERRIATGNSGWDSHLFMADNKDAASLYGKSLARYEAAPDAKILYEGSADFVKVAGRWRKNESLLDYSARASEAAKNAGYDAVWFKRQGDVGTAVFNPGKFKIIEGD